MIAVVEINGADLQSANAGDEKKLRTALIPQILTEHALCLCRLFLYGVGSPSLTVSVLETNAIYDICGADLQRANRFEKNNNSLDITNTH